MDESEEIKTTAVNFVLGQNIAGIIFEIYRALLEKYPEVVKYDREKVEVSVIKWRRLITYLLHTYYACSYSKTSKILGRLW